jgi:acetyl esterase/lipase
LAGYEFAKLPEQAEAAIMGGRLILAVILILGTLTAAAGGEAKAPKDKDAGKPYDVKAARDILYFDTPNDPDPYRHKLDVYQPLTKNRAPVLFFLHGGGWVIGGKDDFFGIYGYGTIARCLAQRGLAVVIPNYRLSPAVQHPEHIKDVARAFAWTCKNVEKYGGDPESIFVSGHSAGGHLAALLAADESYLKQEGRSRKDIRAVIALSGVYRVDDLDLKLAVVDPRGVMRMKVDIRPLAIAFGNDPKVLKEASPLTHVQKGLPPFLLMTAGFDYPPLARMHKEFAAALKDKDCKVEEKEIAWRTHETMLFDIPNFSVERAAADAMMDFIGRHTQRVAKQAEAKEEPKKQGAEKP